jgi:hypothetical protein
MLTEPDQHTVIACSFECFGHLEYCEGLATSNRELVLAFAGVVSTTTMAVGLIHEVDGAAVERVIIGFNTYREIPARLPGPAWGRGLRSHFPNEHPFQIRESFLMSEPLPPAIAAFLAEPADEEEEFIMEVEEED